MEELKQQLINDIQVASNKLSAEAIYYVVKDFYRDIDDSYQEYLMRKAEAMKQPQPEACPQEEE